MSRAPYIYEFPSKNWEGYYAYSSRVGGKFCLLIDVRNLPPLRSGHKNPVVNIPCDLSEVWFMINFASCFMLGKAHGWGTFPKCEVGLAYHLVLGPSF
jgi:hypothetical protein